MIKRGLLLCSFQARKKYSGDDSYIGLNMPYEFNNNYYNNFEEMLLAFIRECEDFHDNENLMKMFAISKGSVQITDRGNYRIISCIVLSGAYGIKSEMTNKDTKEVVYERKPEDADIKQFQLLIYIPKDAGCNEVVKGIFAFETIGNYGVKTITMENMKKYFSECLGLIVQTRSISVQIFIEKLLREERMSRITLIRNVISPDPSDSILIAAGREEKTYIKPRIKDEFIKKVIGYIGGSISDKQVLEIDDEEYGDIKFTFNHSGRIKTVSLRAIDKFSLIEDLPAGLYPNGDVDRGRLVTYVESVITDYAQKIVLVRD
ncbi:MAG: hypothetical protein K6D38_09330 [Pseudobutyrivibrio sp.]|nr:hypothetical protein [Pseudobutyrivibrio sp.]